VKDETGEEKYIRDIFQSEGISIARSFAKLCLNSFGGKLTEQPNRTRTNGVEVFVFKHFTFHIY
jgi:hypothetical protein